MSILEPALAQKFIDKTAKHLEYNINIMNDKGTIIASKDPTRIGTFHEVAYRMLNGTIESGVVNENQKYIGTKPGVNLFIDYKNKHVGVICVTGNPENVHAFAQLVKISMEAMLEYELQMEGDRYRENKAERFLHYLLYEDKIDLTIANRMADELNFNRDLVRVCIVIKYNKEYKSKKIINALTNSEGYSYQDLVTIARNDDIILFKVLSDKVNVGIRDYKNIITEYINHFYEQLPKEYDINKIGFFIGSIQKNIDKYRSSYIHAQELAIRAKDIKGVHFFSDNILNYYRSLATIKAYHEVFNVYDELFSDEEKKMLVELVETLYKNNYNIVYSAKELFIHRNTLLFRLNKFKEMLNIDPISNADDREFLNELAYYFSKK